ncbi:hypothetical protein BDN72DRAFT_536172 [Pluteus cervinus]|uniref:Uncharacterized protein n=1 Tax=Pluteus cervinus TaxID=181527 RepID=A0ACD3AXS3_9AGAR|nr:hypothetical protein BDN72DRAFT_536172 [Pluteus cervinus]
MSLSPNLPPVPTTNTPATPAVSSNDPRSPPANNNLPSPNTLANSSNAQLAAMLTESYREAEALRRELALYKKRLDKAERLVHAYQSAANGNVSGDSTSPPGSNGTPQLSSAAVRTITEYENRVHEAEVQRDEAEARKRMLIDNWHQLDKHLSVMELRAADARAGFSRIASGEDVTLVLPGIPHPSQLHQQQPSMYHYNTMAPPPPRHSGAITAYPPPKSGVVPTSRVRPRAGSLDGSSYVGGLPGQPPAKKYRGDRDDRSGRDERPSFAESHPHSAHLTNHGNDRDYALQSSRHIHASSSHARIPGQPGERHSRHRSHSRSGRSLSRDSNRSNRSSLSLDEMLIQATAVEERNGANGNGIHPNHGSVSPVPPGSDSYRPTTMSAAQHRHRSRRDDPNPIPTSHPRIIDNHHSPYSNNHPMQSQRTQSHHHISDSPPYSYHSRDDPNNHSSNNNGGPPHSSQQGGAHPGSNNSGSTMIAPGGAAPGPPSGSGSGSSGGPSSGPGGPGPTSGQVHVIQTHVFAPVVMGAPVKKSKFPGSAMGSVGNLVGQTSLGVVPGPGSGSIGSNEAPPPAPPISTFPATNEQGQRICRQCGLPGRYKEGKCVEKWGPGPLGPGTVCDRCRKKMKRVERRGTLESQQLAAAAAASNSNSGSLANVRGGGSHSQLSIGGSQNSNPGGGGGLQRSDTTIISQHPTVPSQFPLQQHSSSSGFQGHHRDRDREKEEASYRQVLSSSNAPNTNANTPTAGSSKAARHQSSLPIGSPADSTIIATAVSRGRLGGASSTPRNQSRSNSNSGTRTPTAGRGSGGRPTPPIPSSSSSATTSAGVASKRSPLTSVLQNGSSSSKKGTNGGSAFANGSGNGRGGVVPRSSMDVDAEGDDADGDGDGEGDLDTEDVGMVDSTLVGGDEGDADADADAEAEAEAEIISAIEIAEGGESGESYHRSGSGGSGGSGSGGGRRGSDHSLAADGEDEVDVDGEADEVDADADADADLLDAVNAAEANSNASSSNGSTSAWLMKTEVL